MSARFPVAGRPRPKKGQLQLVKDLPDVGSLDGIALATTEGIDLLAASHPIARELEWICPPVGASIGKCLMRRARFLPARFVIHCNVLEAGQSSASGDAVACGLYNAIRMAEQHGLKSLGFALAPCRERASILAAFRAAFREVPRLYALERVVFIAGNDLHFKACEMELGRLMMRE